MFNKERESQTLNSILFIFFVIVHNLTSEFYTYQTTALLAQINPTCFEMCTS